MKLKIFSNSETNDSPILELFDFEEFLKLPNPRFLEIRELTALLKIKKSSI